MQKPATRDDVDGVLKEYKSFAQLRGLDPTEQECVIAYKDWLLTEDVDINKDSKAVNTVVTKLAHVKTWIK